MGAGSGMGGGGGGFPSAGAPPSIYTPSAAAPDSLRTETPKAVSKVCHQPVESVTYLMVVFVCIV